MINILLLAIIELCVNGHSGSNSEEACEVDIDLLTLPSKVAFIPTNVLLASREEGNLLKLTPSDVYGDGDETPDDLDYYPDLDQLEFTEARLKVCDGNGKYVLSGKGFPRKAPVTIWQFYGNVLDPSGSETEPFPIYKYVARSGPAAAARAGFTNGRLRDADPNVVPVDSNGEFHVVIELDYNPLDAYAAPLVNNRESITQSAYCDDAIEDAIKNNYCQPPYRDNPDRIPIAREYLREFNQATGEQIVDDDGNAVIARSPLPIGGIAFVAHVDLLSHGFLAGVSAAPEECSLTSFGFNCQEHYGLAFFTSISAD
jgi:hypothetical protein